MNIDPKTEPTQPNTPQLKQEANNNGHLKSEDPEKQKIAQENQQSSGQNKFFCSECRKLVTNECKVNGHQEFLISTEQLELDFKKYKLYCEQNDPLYNIAKGLNKIQEALKYLEIPALQADFALKQKVFDEHSKIDDFVDKIIYKDDRLLIDDLDVLPNLDELKKEQYLIDMVHSNYQIIKQFLNRYQLYRYENNQTMEDPLIKAENISNESDYEMDDIGINSKRRSNFLTNNDFYQYQRDSMKKRKPNSDNLNSGTFTSGLEQNNFDNNNKQIPHLNDIHSLQQQPQFQQPGYQAEDVLNDDISKYKKPQVDKDVGLEHMNQKEREILQKMYNTQYEKHHRFTDLEKRMFAKFALLRKIKDGINVSVTTEQWRLNRITVQLWLDKYKKLLKQKHEI